jgi:hypothetical protein
MASASPKPPRYYNDSVFINCPFDEDYKPILRAIVFAIYDSGFISRCALEEIDSGQNRLERILRIISECKYGIHDISRTELGHANLPRFNMPFECGLYWGSQHFGSDWHAKKKLLVLDSEANRYRNSLSDIAGQDIKAHDNNPCTAIDRVCTWLSSHSRRQTIPGGTEIWRRYEVFLAELPAILAEAGVTSDEINSLDYYGYYTKFVEKWLKIREAQAREGRNSRRR